MSTPFLVASANIATMRLSSRRRRITLGRSETGSLLTVSYVSIIAPCYDSYLAGLDITANRLFGHKPATATYVCIWEIHLGDIKVAINAYEARLLSAVGSSFGLNFSDPLNTPAEEYAITSNPDG